MKSEELQKYVQNLSPDLYSFAYVLIPDDLQASQLMIDAVQSFLIQKKTLVEKITTPRNKGAKNLFEEVKYNLFKIVFDLSKRRYQQLKISFQDVENNGGFFSLEFDEKALLFLKEKLHLEIEQLEYTASLTRPEVMAHLYSARLKMVEFLPANKDATISEISGVV